MTFRVDLHLHTHFSADSTIDPKLIVRQLHIHPLVKGVAITDHNTLEGYFRVRKLARAFEDLVVISGVEVATQEGDIIMLGVEELPGHQISLASAIDFAMSRSGVVIVPHPYRSLGIGDYALNIKAHAIETLNPTAAPRENAMAKQLAKNLSLPGVAGTDAHNEREMWLAFTEVHGQPDVDSVLAAIRRGLVKAAPCSPVSSAVCSANID